MKLDRILLLFVLFVLIALFARIEAIRAASVDYMKRKGAGHEVTERRVRFVHYVQGLALVLGYTVLFVLLVPLAVWRWWRDRRR